VLRIGVTQRVEDWPKRKERWDCLDQAWTPLLEGLGILPIPIPNTSDDIEALVSNLQLDGVILSGGNDLVSQPGGTNLAPERDATEHRLIEISIQKNLPILGICRGLQLMATYYGAQLAPVTEHVATRHRITVRETDRLFLSSREEVNSFHKFGLLEENLSADLLPVAIAEDGSVEAIVHQTHRQAAIMWHPERAPKDPRDAELIKAFFGVQQQ
jgi:gamma-glutamyl-gamma-aminobutyrate hydrolase PuuD